MVPLLIAALVSERWFRRRCGPLLILGIQPALVAVAWAAIGLLLVGRPLMGAGIEAVP